MLPSGLQVEELKLRLDDIRWLHHRLEDRKEVRLLALKRNETTCVHRRCELLRNGSLHFTTLQTKDSGNYTLEVFYKNGTVRTKRDFELQVEGESMSRETQTNTNKSFYFKQAVYSFNKP